VEVLVVGGGVGGLTAALALARAGHAVTVVEQDPLPEEDDAESAFATERRGAPQAHQTHGFLARIVLELRTHLPDVLEDLYAVGCTTLPTTTELGEPRPGDEDLAVLIVRRTTFEWVLRRAALREAGIRFRTAGVTGLTHTVTVPVPTVTGVTLADGTTLTADLVVASTGRRSSVPAWLAAAGVTITEEEHASGLMYLSRWYRIDPERAATLDPKLGGDLGFVKYLAVPGDGDTLSITLAIRPDDSELRSALSDPDGFEHACRILPGPQQFFAAGPLAPLGGVRPMGGLLNRIRTFTDGDGTPLVLGFHALGDAHTCTNPLYGRGCSLAVAQAFLLAGAIADAPTDLVERARRYEAASVAALRPSYDFAVQMDRLGADPTGVPRGADGELDPAAKAMAAVFSAAGSDPVIGRGVLRLWNLLAGFDDLMADPEFMTRAMEIMANPDAYPPPERTGPRRSELLAALGGPTGDRSAA
jgi:2-polyprenyl-6-methoxyphenol hydroxylase-like FAD-dependent oxidoreductase